MSRLMRCSRVGGVILYSFDNGHFMAYTSPPPTAEPLLKEKPFGECTFQLSPIAVQRLHSYSTRPRGTLIADQRRACAARPKGKYSRGRMALAPIRTREFSLPRGAAGSQGHSQLKTSNFYIAHRFFVTFFTEESNVPPVPCSRPLFAKSSAGEQAPPALQIMFSFL